MAYLREFTTKCAKDGCVRKAVVEVFDDRNSSYGKYCRPCGVQVINRLNRERDAERKSAAVRS